MIFAVFSLAREFSLILDDFLGNKNGWKFFWMSTCLMGRKTRHKSSEHAYLLDWEKNLGVINTYLCKICLKI